ncbi:recombinase family protein [Streptomyces sp. NPDC048258]|uniref:recombinase family protein n=1 Tax=Streptomyces sp. NPDC048258 TaxID=3365527 RepID=UPI00371ED555
MPPLAPPHPAVIAATPLLAGTSCTRSGADPSGTAHRPGTLTTTAIPRHPDDASWVRPSDVQQRLISPVITYCPTGRVGRGIELATLAEELKASDVGLQFLTGELQGSHDPSGVVFTVLAALSGMERDYIRGRTLEGHESARKRGKTIGGAGVTDDHMLSMALHLREQEMSLRDIAARLVITTGKKKGQHPSPATVMRMLREHDERMPTVEPRTDLRIIP